MTNLEPTAEPNPILLDKSEVLSERSEARRYNTTNSLTATKTSTALVNIPQSLTVVTKRGFYYGVSPLNAFASNRASISRNSLTVSLDIFCKPLGNSINCAPIFTASLAASSKGA